MLKYQEFTSEILYVEMPYEHDNPFNLNSLYDQKLSEIENVVYTRYSVETLYLENEVYKLNVQLINTDSNFLDNSDLTRFSYGDSTIVNVKKNVLKEGRVWTYEEISGEDNVIIIYESTAKMLFGDYKVVGRTLNLGDSSYEIIGILEDTYDVLNYNRIYDVDKDILNVVLYKPLNIELSNQLIDYAVFKSGETDVLKQLIKENISDESVLIDGEEVTSRIESKILSDSRYFLLIIRINTGVVMASLIISIRNFLFSKEYDYHLRRTQGVSVKRLYVLMIFQVCFLVILIILGSIVVSILGSNVVFLSSYNNIYPYVANVRTHDILLISSSYFYISLIFASLYAMKICSKNIINVIRMEG
jgi:hypothetical protein